jgi:hypothetical protein
MRGIDDHDDRLRGHGGIFSGFGVGARQAGSSAMRGFCLGFGQSTTQATRKQGLLFEKRSKNFG